MMMLMRIHSSGWRSPRFQRYGTPCLWSRSTIDEGRRDRIDASSIIIVVQSTILITKCQSPGLQRSRSPPALTTTSGMWRRSTMWRGRRRRWRRNKVQHGIRRRRHLLLLLLLLTPHGRSMRRIIIGCGLYRSPGVFAGGRACCRTRTARARGACSPGRRFLVGRKLFRYSFWSRYRDFGFGGAAGGFVVQGWSYE